MSDDALQLRNCTALEEFRACVALQKEVWGFADNELVPLRIFSLAPKIGGQVIGAWDGEKLVGFAFSIPGTRNRHSYLHSHMLGVKNDYRNRGLGRRIKLFQREDAIAHGYELMDLRSARDQEFLLQPGTVGRARPPLQHQSVRHHIVAAARVSSQRPPGGRVVAEVEASGDAARKRQETGIPRRITDRSAG